MKNIAKWGLAGLLLVSSSAYAVKKIRSPTMYDTPTPTTKTASIDKKVIIEEKKTTKKDDYIYCRDIPPIFKLMINRDFEGKHYHPIRMCTKEPISDDLFNRALWTYAAKSNGEVLKESEVDKDILDLETMFDYEQTQYYKFPKEKKGVKKWILLQ